MSILNDPYRQMNSLAAGLGQQIGGYGQMVMHPETVDLDVLKAQVARLQAEIDKRELHTPMQGPTRAELKKHETLRSTWEEYCAVRKLLGI